MIDSINNISRVNSIYKIGLVANYNGLNTPIGRFQNSYFQNTISSQNMSFIKGISNSMNTLYSSAQRLNGLKGTDKTNTEDVKKYTEEFVKNFNDSLDTLGERKDKNNTLDRLHSSLQSVGEVNKHTLKEIGIEVGNNGKLSIDEKLFNESLEKNLDKVKDTLSTVGKKTKDVAMRGMATSTKDLLNDKTNKLQNVMIEEDYYAGIRKMAGNRQFMSFYYSAEAMLNMYL